MASDDIQYFRRLYAKKDRAFLVGQREKLARDTPRYAAVVSLLADMEDAAIDKRHRELVEAMKAGGGVHISSSGDTNISGSNLAGHDSTSHLSAANPADKKGIIKWIIAISVSVFGGLIVAYFKGCFPSVFR